MEAWTPWMRQAFLHTCVVSASSLTVTHDAYSVEAAFQGSNLNAHVCTQSEPTAPQPQEMTQCCVNPASQ